MACHVIETEVISQSGSVVCCLEEATQLNDKILFDSNNRLYISEQGARSHALRLKIHA